MIPAIAGILVSVAGSIGADLVKGVLSKRLGETGGELAGRVIDEIAQRAGVTPKDLPNVPDAQLQDAVRSVDDDMPQLIELWAQGLQGQFALLQAEQQEGGWQTGWRWGWMYLLGFMWFIRLMVVPVVDSTMNTNLAPGMNIEVMMTLTSWFIALYMGGHTLKSFGTTIADAIKGMRRG